MTHKTQQTNMIDIYTVEYDDPRGNYRVASFSAANDRQAIEMAKSYGNVHGVTKDHGRITVYSGR